MMKMEDLANCGSTQRAFIPKFSAANKMRKMETEGETVAPKDT